MQPMLDDLELPQVQEITTLERRVLAEHRAPGMAGSLLQNLGRRPARLLLWGVATGPDALEFTRKLESKFTGGQPVPFAADIVADARIDKVIISDLRVQDLAGRPQRFAYVVALREHIDPVEAADTAGLDAEQLDEARALVDGMLPGLLGGLDFVTGVERFVPRLGSLLSRLQKVNAAAGGG